MILYQPTVLEYTFERLLQMNRYFFILNWATNQSSNNSMLLLFFNYNYITCAIYQDYDSDSNGQRERRRNF